jgi:hypothetical protein
MAAYAEASDASTPEAVQRAWTRTGEHWDDPVQHDELFRLIAVHGCYAWGARCYRTRSDAVAARQLERLQRAAEVTMLAGATVRPDPAARPYRAAVGVLAILIVMIVAGLFYAAIRDRQTGAQPSSVVRPLQPGRPAGSSSIK